MQAADPACPRVVEPSTPSLYELSKRVLDVVASAALLCGLAPVFAVCALAIRLDSAGPVFFRQQRVGRCGKLFTILKFRSMRADADAGPHRAYVVAFIQGQAPRHQSAEGAVYKLVDDPRITRVGRWLRRTSLDELPQLWNVLRGDMSLVGPRPPIPYEIEHYQPAQLQRLAVRPGLTGLWQISARSTSTFEAMVVLDLEYIRRRSLGLDLRILLGTIPAVLRARGAH
ncbi:MAG: sugar transferase [Chloroflexi bacterium]|nr:sugar transferase [Chloroflexota bacterium]